MKKTQRSKVFKIFDTVVTVTFVIVIVTAVVLGIILLIRTLSAKKEKKDVDFVSAPIHSESPGYGKITVGQGNVIGVYFNALAPFSAAEVKGAGGDRLSLSLYSFDTDYETSVSGKRLAHSDFSGFEEGSWLTSGFQTFEAGEYLAVISSPSIAELFTSYDQSPLTLNKSVIYKNGELLLTLSDPSGKKETMKKLTDGYDIDGISVYEPSLNDIFVEYAENQI